MDLLPSRWALLLAPVVTAMAWRSMEGPRRARSSESGFSGPGSSGDMAHSAGRVLRGAVLLAAGMEFELHGASKAGRIRCPLPPIWRVGGERARWPAASRQPVGALGHVSGGLWPGSGSAATGQTEAPEGACLCSAGAANSGSLSLCAW